MVDPGKILILGAGPTGLGAAYRLQELGHANFVLLEKESSPGGLASSYIDDEGFTWDVGGHVQFSHYSYYDAVLDEVLKGAWLWHDREAWIWMKDRFLPYPFQNNIHRLDREDCEKALAGLEVATQKKNSPEEYEDFRQWILSTFGDGIAELFMLPYNVKVWGWPLELLGTDWIHDRVALPDPAEIRRNLTQNRDDVRWGPNAKFRFPLHGGTGAIWRAVAGKLDTNRLLYGKTVQHVDLSNRVVAVTTGEEFTYDKLITSLPLDIFAKLCSDLSTAAQNAASSMLFSSVHVLGVGVRGDLPDSLHKKCWMYFPDPASPYYRVTVFSNYSPNNVPGKQYWSLMAEVCETSHKRIRSVELKQDLLNAMVRDRLLPANADVVSFWHKKVRHGYPTPFAGRDRKLAEILPELQVHNVFSRGRFGGWKYEVSNQDHSFMQGVELANFLLTGEPEITYPFPKIANSNKQRSI